MEQGLKKWFIKQMLLEQLIPEHTRWGIILC